MCLDCRTKMMQMVSYPDKVKEWQFLVFTIPYNMWDIKFHVLVKIS